MNNDNLRYRISRLLGVIIPEGKWEAYLNQLDKEGIPNRKQLIGMLLAVCQQIEVLENKIAALEQPRHINPEASKLKK